ncbi:hypothetical protein VTI74DRAFT_2904 [Chaetomium olivicolor]
MASRVGYPPLSPQNTQRKLHHGLSFASLPWLGQLRMAFVMHQLNPSSRPKSLKNKLSSSSFMHYTLLSRRVGFNKTWRPTSPAFSPMIGLYALWGPAIN